MPNQVPATEEGILNGEPESQTGADSSTGDEKPDSGKKEEGGSKEEKAFKYWQSKHDKLDRETKELRELRELVGGEETLKAGAQIALWAKKNPEEFRRFQEFLANPKQEFPAELVEKYQSEMKKVLRDRTVTALEAFKRVATWEDLKIALDDKKKRQVEKAKGA